jgi:hypothetical protein
MSRPFFRHARLVPVAGGLLVLLLGAFGCGSGNKSQLTGASVSGLVRYQGKPVTGGIIQFWSDNKDGNQTAQGGIEGDGTYKVLNAPLGDCKVVVKTESVKNDRRAMARKFAAEQGVPVSPQSGPPKVYMEIAPKYTDLKKTDVQITVQKGSQTQDIDLP